MAGHNGLSRVSSVNVKHVKHVKGTVLLTTCQGDGSSDNNRDQRDTGKNEGVKGTVWGDPLLVYKLWTINFVIYYLFI